MTDTLTHNGLLGGRRISRREFIRGVGVTVAGSVLLATGIEELGRISLTLAPAPVLVRSMFAPHIGETFHIDLGVSGVLALELFKVRDLRAASKSATAGIDGEQRFSLLFRGPVERSLGQETYHFEHDRIGRTRTRWQVLRGDLQLIVGLKPSRKGV